MGSVCVFFKIGKYVLTPIGKINDRMKVLMKSKFEIELEADGFKINSKEIKFLFEAFSEILTTRRFANSDFLGKTDARALLDFADTYVVLNTNPKAQGICMTNMGHINFMHGDFV